MARRILSASGGSATAFNRQLLDAEAPSQAPRSEAPATGAAHKVLFMGLFPPPVDGQRLMTERVYERFSALATVERFDLDRIPSLGHQLSKLLSATAACFALLRHRAKGYSALYLAPHSGGLLFLSCLIVGVARCCGYSVAAHYHSYLNVARRSRLMGAFVAICGPKAVHIVLAPPMARDLRCCYPSVRRVVSLSNCGFIAPYAPANRSFGGRPLRIGHLSNLSREKGIAAVLQCMRVLRARGAAVELWLGGPAEDEATQSLIEAAREEFGERFNYLGRLSGEEVRRFYRDVDIFLFPTVHRHEAEPLVVIDAMASGVPVLATDRGCIAHLLGASGGYVFRVEDFVASATERVAMWIERPDQLAEASRLVRTRFLDARAQSLVQFEALVAAIVGEGSLDQSHKQESVGQR